MAKCAVIGVGNLLRSDDAAGVITARKLQNILIPAVDVFETEGECGQLLHWFAQYSEVYLIDAFDARSSAASWFRIEASREPIPSEFVLGSTHAFGLAWSIELARALGQLPRRVVIFGIPGRTFLMGTSMSWDTLQATECVLEAMRNELGP